MKHWSIDLSHSQIQFSVKHLGISTVRGTFAQFGGTLTEADGLITAATVDIDVASLTTGNADRDTHLRSGDFFDVDTHPTATFVLREFRRVGDDLVTVLGTLSLRGITQDVLLKGEIGGPATDPWGVEKVSASLETTINRKDWGLVWNVALEAGGLLVSEDVKLRIELQAAATA